MAKKILSVALAGQANVGKSVIFNFLTGLHQHVGNWAGKTVERAEGTLYYKGFYINVLDLPGIYSLTAYSIEEIISRDFITQEKPDFVIDVVDSTHLERNLLFTLQLLELERPVVLCLNMFNLLKEKGMEINLKKLQEILGVPIVPCVAIQGKGITKLLDKGIFLYKNKKTAKSLRYGKEAEERINQLTKIIADTDLPYSKRWLGIKLLEKDKIIEKLFEKENMGILKKARELQRELEKIHGHDSSIVIADERSNLSSKISEAVLKINKPKKITVSEKLDFVTNHKIWGYPIMLLILGSMFLVVFKLGDLASTLMGNLFYSWQLSWQGSSLVWSAIYSVLILVEIAIPYILPFYLLLFLLEDWGYLARVAFLMDGLMHKIGVHGKACIPLMLSFGCNVPGCLACKIMETGRERLITGFLSTFIPCSAVTVVIFGLVGKYVGFAWAFGLYFLVFLTIIMLGKLSAVLLPGEATELIMEMPDYKIPNLKTIFIRTWFRLREFIYIAAPLVVISGIIIEGAYLSGWLAKFAGFLSPVTVNWLGLPAITGVLLILGILRKELILIMLASLLGTDKFLEVLTREQMIVLGIVSIFYVPCIATISALKREFGWSNALLMSGFKIIYALILGGVAAKIFRLLY